MVRTLSELISALTLRASHVPGQSDPAIRSVSGDSRAVVPGTLFVAVIGMRVDGHSFIPAAIAAGAVAVVGSRPYAALVTDGLLDATVPYIEVADGRLALAQLAAAFHGYPSRTMTVIGVTGTDGKTTTASLLEAILGGDGEKVGVVTTLGARIDGVIEDTGFHVTTPEAPQLQYLLSRMVEEDCRYAVVESTSFGLDQKRVAAVDFDVACVTNITHEHLDIHGSFDAYVAAKGLLYRALFQSAVKPGVEKVAVVNRDDPASYVPVRAIIAAEIAAQPDRQVRLLSYSLAPGADVSAREIRFDADATTFWVDWWGEPFSLRTCLIGHFNVANTLCSVTAALGLGIPISRIQSGVADLQGVLGRMERIDCGQEFLAVVDFAHSPASLERALETLRPMVAECGRLIAVFGSAGERDRAKRGLMGAVSGRLADFTVITAEDPRTEDLATINQAIAEGVRSVSPTAAYRIVPDRAEAIREAVAMARRGDVVATFGKGHERSLCFGQIETPWDEQEAMRDALRTVLSP